MRTTTASTLGTVSLHVVVAVSSKLEQPTPAQRPSLMFPSDDIADSSSGKQARLDFLFGGDVVPSRPAAVHPAPMFHAPVVTPPTMKTNSDDIRDDLLTDHSRLFRDETSGLKPHATEVMPPPPHTQH